MKSIKLLIAAALVSLFTLLVSCESDEAVISSTVESESSYSTAPVVGGLGSGYRKSTSTRTTTVADLDELEDDLDD